MLSSRLVRCLQHLLDTLCRDVETDLRLHIHMHLQLDSRNPFRVTSNQLSTFLRMMPLRLFEHDINARGKPSLFYDISCKVHSTSVFNCLLSVLCVWTKATTYFWFLFNQSMYFFGNHSRLGQVPIDLLKKNF